MKVSFVGAAGSVTGSKTLLDTKGGRFLVDCGMFQERDLQWRNWEPFPFDPESVDAVLLTHAHLDHCGLLPKLVKDGFRGKIYGTAPTRDIARIVLEDSARIQTEDAKYKRKRHRREGRKGRFPAVPLYTVEEAVKRVKQFAPVQYAQRVRIGPGVSATFSSEGHVLGAASIRIEAESKSVLFSGDIGRWNRPLLRNPDPPPGADYVVMESTYGNFLHDRVEDQDGKLARIINETREAGGHVIIPSFAVEKAQELLYMIKRILLKNMIQRIRVFLDSPVAINVTKVFKRYSSLFDEETAGFMRDYGSPFSFEGLEFSQSTAESKSLNELKESAVIIAGSGMCTGGRIKHHLYHNLPRRESTVVFVGYQAAGTLGRNLLKGERAVRVHGELVPVNARVVRFGGLSGHGDRDDLIRWVSAQKTVPERIFVIHGEPDVARKFVEYATRLEGWNMHVPEYLEEATLT